VTRETSLVIRCPVVPYVRMTRRGKHKLRAQRYISNQHSLGWLIKIEMQSRGIQIFGREPLQVEVVIEEARPEPDHRRDGDNLLKAVLDAANGILWADDRWIDGANIVRTGGTENRVTISVRARA
jgi:Holliday junction resolvase RusA-like endonuclease